jgi:hypothetical protein
MATFYLKDTGKNIYVKWNNENMSKLVKDWRFDSISNRMHSIKKKGIKSYGGKISDKTVRIEEDDGLKLALFSSLTRKTDSMTKTDKLSRIIFSLSPEKTLMYWASSKDMSRKTEVKKEILNLD